MTGSRRVVLHTITITNNRDEVKRAQAEGQLFRALRQRVSFYARAVSHSAVLRSPESGCAVVHEKICANMLHMHDGCCV